MRVRKYTEVKIDPKDDNLVFTILDLAGWYEGRNVDIAEIEEFYAKSDYKLNEPSKEFFREFFGLPNKFCFKFKKPQVDKWSVGGNELMFDTFVSNGIFDFKLEIEKQDFEREKLLVFNHEPNGAVPVADCGFHLGGTLWIGNSGNFFRTYYYAPETIECYDSVIKMFEHDFGKYRTSDELFVSLGGYAKEWGVGGDAYLKRYLQEYGEI